MIPELVQSWLVNLVLGMAVYLLVGVLWALSIYRVFRNTKCVALQLLDDAKSSLGDATSSLGDAKSSLGDA
jgi:hypothetical protein